MTHQAILDFSIEKAMKNGFNIKSIPFIDVCDISPELYIRFLLCEHFAKAYWGEEKTCCLCGLKFGTKKECGEWCDEEPVWKYHLKEMVVLSTDEKFEYLEQYL